jgi:hypothetical protein
MPTISEPAIVPKPSTRGLSDRTRMDILWYLSLGWAPQLIADTVGCSRSAVYKLKATLLTYGSIRKPVSARSARLGLPPKIREEDAQALFGELIRSRWMYQDEMVKWLRIERGIIVTQQAISLFLKARG